MKVKLLQYTPEPEKIIAAAAKLCYSSVGIEDIMDNLNKENIDKFLNMLMSLGHDSPIEHVSFTFGVEGISRALSHQLVRHRIASYSQQSQRYVKLEQFEYIMPPAIRNNKMAQALFARAMKDDQEVYNLIVLNLKKDYKDQGIPEKVAEKKAIEDARYVFPNACETKIIATFNFRSLANFIRHRACFRAQWEIRELAIEMIKLVKPICPTLSKYLRPNCCMSGCKEGKMCCGKVKEVKDFFEKL